MFNIFNVFKDSRDDYVFANNWIYPLSNFMADLTLHVGVEFQGGGGPDMDHTSATVNVFYDPALTSRTLLRHYSEDDKFILISSGCPPEIVERGTSFDYTKNTRGIFGTSSTHGTIEANWAQVEDAVRVKLFEWTSSRVDCMEIMQRKLRRMQESGIPHIQDHPRAFLLYLFRNLSNMKQYLSPYSGHLEFDPLSGAKRTHICMYGTILEKIFQQSLADYAELEPGWFCLSQSEVAA